MRTSLYPKLQWLRWSQVCSLRFSLLSFLTLRCLWAVELLPGDMTCAKDTRDLVIECCVGKRGSILSYWTYSDERACLNAEFIHLISSEANEICEQESKKTIAPEHIIGALKVRLLAYALRTLIYSRAATRLRLVYRRGRRCPERSQTTAKGTWKSSFPPYFDWSSSPGSRKESFQVWTIGVDGGTVVGTARTVIRCESGQIPIDSAIIFSFFYRAVSLFLYYKCYDLDNVSSCVWRARSFSSLRRGESPFHWLPSESTGKPSCSMVNEADTAA